MQNDQGFSLLELMVVLVIVAILATLAWPSYQSYVRRALAAQAEQELQQLAQSLERYKTRNFSYQGFQIEPSALSIPQNSVGAKVSYQLYLRDLAEPDKNLDHNDAMGQAWVMLAEANSALNHKNCQSCHPLQNNNFSYLMTSTGLRCKTMGPLSASEVLTAQQLEKPSPCGEKSEAW